MSTQQEANFIHATYYAQVLLDADTLYQQGNQRVITGLALFDQNWPNIQLGQAWTIVNAEQNIAAAQLCCEYPIRGSFCLYL